MRERGGRWERKGAKGDERKGRKCGELEVERKGRRAEREEEKKDEHVESLMRSGSVVESERVQRICRLLQRVTSE